MKKKENEIPYKLMVVDWNDASSSSKWTDVASFKRDDIPYIVRTVGYKIHEDNDAIHLASNMCITHQDISCIMSIPKGMIKKKRYI